MEKYNITVVYNKLYDYNIRNYYKKYNFLPYLWTSSYGLLRLLKEYNINSKNKIKKEEIKEYINIVHNILGIHTVNGKKLSFLIKNKLKWIREKPDIINLTKPFDNLIGSLRIGKFEQNNGEEPGIYLHYTTKWIYALLISNKILNNKIYMYQACNILLTMCEKNININNNNITYPRKMNQILSVSEQPNEISHDPLDVFICLFNSIYSINKYENNKSIKDFYLNKLIFFLNQNINRIKEYNKLNLYTSDYLGIGFLLTSCFKIRIIINKINSNIFNNIIKKINNYSKKTFLKFLKKFYILLLNTTKECFLKYGIINPNIENNDAYRWLGISIGLRAIKLLKIKTEKFIKNNNPIYIKNTLNIDKKALEIINIIYNNYQVRNNIHTNFNTISYCKNNWNEHIDINIVTFLYSLNPIFLF